MFFEKEPLKGHFVSRPEILQPEDAPGEEPVDLWKQDVRSPHTEFLKTRKEVERLCKNRLALFDIMSDMVFLIRSDFVIQYMNSSAIETFGNLNGQVCYQALDSRRQPCENCPAERSLEVSNSSSPCERKIRQLCVEYKYASFQGYRDEQLVMLVMRDISQRKRQESELNQINNNIEKVLHQRIQALNESERVRRELGREVNILKRELDRFSKQQTEMVGDSPKFRELREMIDQVADSDATILITGESGTGKELVADIIHKRSRRNGRPFLKFNCAAVSEGLLESDLFGYEKGSFTGATARRIGKFEIADRGTIFLDEIGDISPRMQAALLRVLQNGEVVRVGGNEAVSINVRIITATNVDLAVAVREKRFRRDLFYRLNVINIHVPPLRERKEDIVPLISHFIKKYCTAFKKEIDYLPNRIIDRFLRHDWPGNIRELENVIKRAVLLARDNVITEKELCFEANSPRNNTRKEPFIEKRMLEQYLKDTIAELEAKIIAGAIDKFEGNPQVVARVLGLGKTTFYQKMKRYGLIAPKHESTKR